MTHSSRFSCYHGSVHKNKYLIPILVAIALLIIAGVIVYILFLRNNEKSKYDHDYTASDSRYCQIARKKENINETIPCDEKLGSLSDRKNSVLVTFHLYTPSDWSYENYQTYEIDMNTKEIVDGIMPN